MNMKDKIKDSLDFLSSFCGIMGALGESEGFQEAACTDIATFASKAQEHVCFLRDQVIKD